MKLKQVGLLCASLMTGNAFAVQQAALPPIHVVVVGVDGLSPDGVRQASTPHMDGLMEQGAYSFEARAVLPTSSSPNWASMINGAGPEQHGIISNAWRPDDYSIEPTISGVGPVFASIFDLITLADPDAVTASIYDWGGFGRLYNRNAVTIDIDADGPEAAVDSAVAAFHSHQPVFTFVHLDHVDAAGHRDGHGTPAYYASVERADHLIGLILAGLEAAGMQESATVIVTSDHGGVGTGHGGESMAEVEIPWIIRGPRVPPGIRIENPIDTYDTASTVATLLGLTQPDGWIGRPVYEAFGLLPPPAPAGPGGIDYVVVIGVDGLSPDGVQKAATPVLNAIIPRSAYSFHARGVLSTSSSQNWSSMIMGAGPEQHGITSNAWERDNFSIVPTEAGPEGLFPSIFSEVRAVEPDAFIASVYDWGGFGRLFPGSVVDANIDGDGPQDTVDQVREQFAENKPRLTFVHLDHVDHALHTYGHGTDSYYASVAEADRLIGEIMDGLATAGMADRTLVIITSDHGGLGKGHGGSSMQELEIPWIAYGPQVVQGRNLTVPINIYDTAATVLYALQITPPYAWIGRPVESAFLEEGATPPEPDIYVPAPRIAPVASRSLQTEAVTVSMQVDDAEAVIHYTVDGSDPSAASLRYQEALRLESSTTVRAVTLRDGHMSMHSQADYRVVESGYTPAVSYSYYEGEWDLLPDFDQLQPVRTGTVYEIDLVGVTPRSEDFFAIRFSGLIEITEAGSHTFYSRSDDGTKLYVNDQLVVNNDGNHGAIERSGQIELEPGMARIVVEYFESSGGEHLEVSLLRPGSARAHMTYRDFASQ
ncbi:MAG: alkaline phosphatase family protein [Bacteroidota bacterium]|nr:alkaline phosphatase family protein [Bacteroidota bacterium]